MMKIGENRRRRRRITIKTEFDSQFAERKRVHNESLRMAKTKNDKKLGALRKAAEAKLAEATAEKNRQTAGVKKQAAAQKQLKDELAAVGQKMADLVGEKERLERDMKMTKEMLEREGAETFCGTSLSSDPSPQSHHRISVHDGRFRPFQAGVAF